jgi:alpha-beta hydrolase superfamily lysophospholipase
VLVPGAAEHTGRYEHVAGRLNEAAYIVNGLDMRGLGRSDGEPFKLRDKLETYAADLHHFHQAVEQSEDPALPRFMLAHSMGGGIAVRFMAKHPEYQPAGVVLSGPLVGLDERIPRAALEFVMWLGERMPGLRVPMNPASWVSRNRDVVLAFKHDPHVFHGPMRIPVLAGLIGGGLRAAEEAPLVTQPFLLIAGTADKLVPFDAGRKFYENAGSADKTLKLYPGLYHEVLNEPERDQVLDDVVAWIDERCVNQARASHVAAV